jgi:taurine dioxygenase
MLIEPVTPTIGARIHDIDLANLDDKALDEFHQTVLDHKVVFLRAPHLTVEQHLALAERFGETEVHAFFPNMGVGNERISVLDSDDGTRASMWHSDESFLERPPLGTLLHAVIIPDTGGDTVWSDQEAAYDALSPSMKRYLEGMTAEHSLHRVDLIRYQHGGIDAATAGARFAEGRSCHHPVVRTHPDTGRKSIYVNQTYTRHLDGVSLDESETILSYLYRHQTRHEFSVRHRWTEGDLVMWDNRSVQHIALADYDGRRRMHRVSVLGARPS